MMREAGQSVKGKLALLASATALAVALPSSVFAIGLIGDDGDGSLVAQFGFTPAAADPDIARLVAQSADGQARMVRFTPAGAAASQAERSVTVAVRVDRRTAQALAASSAFASAAPQSDSAPSALRVTPTRYNLGLARGYGSFAQSPSQIAAPPAERARMTEGFSLSSALSRAAIPDISTYAPRKSANEEESRFGARVAMGEDRNVAATRDARSSVRDQMLDVAGSYRITNNLDVTAGVRYEQDRDIVPLPDIEQQDSQAVYVGTQFRF